MMDRDGFAAAALAGLVMRLPAGYVCDPRDVAVEAYELADAMVVEQAVEAQAGYEGERMIERAR